jgi:hypothetical protein
MPLHTVTLVGVGRLPVRLAAIGQRINSKDVTADCDVIFCSALPQISYPEEIFHSRSQPNLSDREIHIMFKKKLRMKTLTENRHIPKLLSVLTIS